MLKKALFFLFLCSSQLIYAVEPDTVSYVDLERYSGQWFEIERFPNRFQNECGATRATYTLKDEKVAVLNECKVKGSEDEIQQAKGTAFVVDKQSQSKLKVSFVPLLRHFGFFAGEYWILELDPDYRYALVGDSKRQYLWILSRDKELDQDILEELKLKAQDQGFDISKLIKTPIWY